VKLTVDTKQVEKNFKNLARQLPYITMLALNDTAFDAQSSLKSTVKGKLKIKKQSVANAFRVKKASKTNLVSQVFVPTTAWQNDVLSQHFHGGDRERKGLEDILRHMGAMSKSQILTPSGTGFVKRRGYKQITTALKKAYPRGYKTNIFKRSKGRPNREDYFIATKRDKRTSHLSEGVYYRPAGEEFLVSILTISDSPRYTKRLDVKQITQKVVDRRFNIHFDKAIQKAMRTSR